MKRKITYLLITTLTLIGTSSFVILTNTGIAGYTGSPGESSCAGCHAGSVGITTVSISSVPAFTNNTYYPGTTYTVNISVTNSNFGNFGFGCEILNTKDSSAGIMTTPLTGVKFLTAFNGRQNAVQTAKKVGSGSAVFSFVWVAPSKDSVKIYAAGNAVNNNASTSGDRAGNTFLALAADPAAGINESLAEDIINVTAFPNPTSEDLNLKYFLSKTAQVKAGLYDMQGNEIKELFNERQSRGLRSFKTILPLDIQKGIYLVKFFINGKSSGSRIIIIQ